MKAVIWTRYGAPDALELGEIPRPEPGAQEILLKTHATTVFAGDAEMRRLDVLPLFYLPFRLHLGWRRPKRLPVLGQEISGVVEAVGTAVTQFKPGDALFGPLTRFGAYAEYVAIPEKAALIRKPDAMSHAEAAALCVGGCNALVFHRLADINPGEQVLLIGAGGSIGTLSLQLAKLAGAEVTVVDSADKLPRLRELGADHVIDYQSQSLAAIEQRFDVVFNIVNKSSFGAGVKLLKPQGRLLLMNLFLGQLLRSLWVNCTSRKRVRFKVAGYRRADLQHLAELVTAGRLRVVIDRTFPLDQMPAAHAYLESGVRVGSIAVDIPAYQGS